MSIIYDLSLSGNQVVYFHSMHLFNIYMHIWIYHIYHICIYIYIYISLGYSKFGSVLVLPDTIIQRADFTLGQPARNAMEVINMLASPNGLGAFIGSIRLAFNAWILDQIATNGASINLNIYQEQESRIVCQIAVNSLPQAHRALAFHCIDKRFWVSFWLPSDLS